MPSCVGKKLAPAQGPVRQQNSFSVIAPLLSVHFRLCATTKAIGDLQDLKVKRSAGKLPSFTGVWWLLIQ